MLALALLVGCTGAASRPTDPRGTPSGTGSTSSRPAPHAPSQAALIYAAALRGRAPVPARLRHDLYLSALFCRDMVEIASRGPCEPGPIPAAVRRDLTRLVGPKLHITAHPPTQIPRTLLGKIYVVRLGSARVHGSHARVPIDYYCGPLCGEGETLVISKRGAGWIVTGTTGAAWIS